MTNKHEIKQKSVGGAISYAIRTGFVYIVAVAATAILSALLTPEQYGIFFIVTAIITFFTFLSDVGLAAALVQKKEDPSVNELQTTFTVQQILAIFIFLLILGLTPLWKTYTHLNTEGLWLLYALGFSFILASLKTIPSILLERNLDFHILAIPQVVEQLTFYGIVVWCAYIGWGVTSFTIGVIARSVVGVILIYSLKRWPIGLALDRHALRQLLRFGVKFQLNDLLARLKDDLYFVFLARFISPTQLGYLGWAKRWSMFPYQFTVQNVVAVTFPTYSRLQDNKTDLVRAIEKSLFFITLFIFPILLGMAIMAYPLTIVITAYAKWQPALIALLFFCGNISIAALTSPITNALNAIGKINYTLRLMILWTVLTWCLTPFALRLWGYNGVAVVAFVVSATSIIAMIWLKRELPIHYFRSIWRQIIATLIMGAFLLTGLPFWSKSLGWLLLGIILGGVSYAVSWFFIGYETLKSELLSLRRK